MNHIQLHNELSDTLLKLKSGEIEPKLAKEIFNGAGKLIANCRTELVAASFGIPMEIPLLEISKDDSRRLQTDNGFRLPI